MKNQRMPRYFVKGDKDDLVVEGGGARTPRNSQRVIGAPVATPVKGKGVMWERKVTGKSGDGEWARPGQKNRR